MESVLDEEWGAAKGYLRTGPEGPDWFYDREGSRRKLHRPSACGASTCWPTRKATRCSIPRSTIRWASIRRRKSAPSCSPASPPSAFAPTANGVPYMIRSGLWVDHDGHKYYLAIGRAVDYNDKVISDFTRNYFAWCRWSSCSAAFWDGSWPAARSIR